MAYHHYGGRGIKVCERWEDFDTFRADMGPRLSRGWSLERKNVDGNYEPLNCIWIRKGLQGRNKRNSIKLPHPVTGGMIPAAELAEILGISYQVMRARMLTAGTWPQKTESPQISVSSEMALNDEDKNNDDDDDDDGHDDPAAATD